MGYRIVWNLVTAVALLSTTTHAWVPAVTTTTSLHSRRLAVAAQANVETDIVDTDASKKVMMESLTKDLISKMRFRQLRKELKARQLDVVGTTGQLRERLKDAAVPKPPEETTRTDLPEECMTESELDALVDAFVDKSDPDFEFKELMREIMAKSEKGHWKAATRKLKKLDRRYRSSHCIPPEIYLKTLEACSLNRLQGARASEPARKIMEQMVELGYEIPSTVGNFCIKNCLGTSGPDSTHQGFGGIDTALAMTTALEMSGTPIQLETYDKLAVALAREGSMEDALALVRRVVVDQSETPPLSTFAAIALAAVAKPEDKHEESVLTILAYAKAAGYELDSIASIEDGRTLLACGVVAAERLDNAALGLRLLTAASKAKGVDPDRGDDLVALSSSAAQRACTLIHKRAINRAVTDGQWKLAVRLLTLMLERGLRPSPWIWRNVVACCAKAEKSRKATALLLDWVTLYEDGKAERPPVSVFNTCMNACEICNEEELTLLVLNSMKKTHDTEGNLITFNIALKRLAKQGNYLACEGIIIGMLQGGIEPSVVSYTTSIAACASSDPKQATVAYEWLKRMRSRRVNPNVLTYNTALAACLDGKLESTVIASSIASEMIADVERQLTNDDDTAEENEYTNVLPDATTKYLARRLMEQLKSNWKEGTIEKREATQTIRVPLLKLVDFQKSQAAARLREKLSEQESKRKGDDDQVLATRETEMELEFAAASSYHRTAEV